MKAETNDRPEREEAKPGVDVGSRVPHDHDQQAKEAEQRQPEGDEPRAFDDPVLRHGEPNGPDERRDVVPQHCWQGQEAGSQRRPRDPGAVRFETTEVRDAESQVKVDQQRQRRGRGERLETVSREEIDVHSADQQEGQAGLLREQSQQQKTREGRRPPGGEELVDRPGGLGRRCCGYIARRRRPTVGTRAGFAGGGHGHSFWNNRVNCGAGWQPPCRRSSVQSRTSSTGANPGGAGNLDGMMT